MNGATTIKNFVEEIFFLTELLGARAYLNGRKIGKLKDMVAVDQGKVAEVTHFQIARPFGEAASADSVSEGAIVQPSRDHR